MRSSVGRQINSADIGQISEVPDTAGTVLCGPTRHVHTMNVVSMRKPHSIEISVSKWLYNRLNWLKGKAFRLRGSVCVRQHSIMTGFKIDCFYTSFPKTLSLSGRWLYIKVMWAICFKLLLELTLLHRNQINYCHLKVEICKHNNSVCVYI